MRKPRKSSVKRAPELDCTASVTECTGIMPALPPEEIDPIEKGVPVEDANSERRKAHV